MWRFSQCTASCLLGVVFAGCMLSPAAGSPLLSTPASVSTRGATDCEYGGPDCNTCVFDVRAAFGRLSSTPISKARYQAHGGEQLPPFQSKLSDFSSHRAHVQGVGLLSRADSDDPWFVLTRSTPGYPGGAGIFMVQMAHKETSFYYPIGGIDHPGGLQTLGQHAFVASDCTDELRCGTRTFVDIFDLSSPGSKHAFVQRFRVGDQGEPGFTSTVSSVGVTRLQSGHFLMFLYGKDSLHEGWFYVSDRPTLSAATRWLYRGYWTLPLGKDDEYQNTNFVTECGTGDIYMFGMGNGRIDAASLFFGYTLDRAAGNESMSMLKLDVAEDGHLGMDLIARRTFEPGGDGYCSFRAASSVHATAEHELMLHCSTRKSPDTRRARSVLKLAVFAPSSP